LFDLLEDRIADCLGNNRPTHVIICAVLSDMDRCWREKELSRRINVENTVRLIEDARSLGAKPVYLSSNFVFDGRMGDYTDDHPYSPVNEYGRQKAEVERYMRAHVPEGWVARLGPNVGDRPGERHLFSEWLDLVEAGQPIVCIEGSRISPTWVEDVARGLVLGCEKNLSGVYNLANPEAFYRDELARLFCGELGRTVPVIRKSLHEFGFLDNRALKSNLDSSRFMRVTGMRFTPMREVIRNFLDQLSIK
jgi:dTDP-4-dehydrorhamnose reductase